MSLPVAPTEPLPFADALADIRLLQQRVATATRVLLRKHGWRYTCLTPPHLWLWSKQLPGGRTIFTDLNTALAIESSLAHYPPAPPHPTPAPLVLPPPSAAPKVTPDQKSNAP